MTMKEDAILKAIDHVIPFEEVSNFGTKVGGIDDEPIEEPVDTKSPGGESFV
jgi:hypothetical protein